MTKNKNWGDEINPKEIDNNSSKNESNEEQIEPYEVLVQPKRQKLKNHKSRKLDSPVKTIVHPKKVVHGFDFPTESETRSGLEGPELDLENWAKLVREQE